MNEAQAFIQRVGNEAQNKVKIQEGIVRDSITQLGRADDTAEANADLHQRTQPLQHKKDQSNTHQSQNNSAEHQTQHQAEQTKRCLHLSMQCFQEIWVSEKQTLQDVLAFFGDLSTRMSEEVCAGSGTNQDSCREHKSELLAACP